MKARISVVIPVYNTKQYLQEAIDSLLQQEEYIYQIIIINDGSTDGSKELLEKLYGNNEKITIINTENNGQGHARNLGTEQADGDFIYYFDSDDILGDNLFKDFHNELVKNPTLELFCFSGESFLDPTISINDISRPSELSKTAFKRNLNLSCESGEDAFKLLVDNSSFSPVPWLYIFKRSIITKSQINFSPIKYEDEEFTHKLFIYAGQTEISNKIYFHRRVRAGSTMQLNRTFQDFQGYFTTIDSLYQLKNLEFIKPITKSVLQSRIFTFIKLIIELKASTKVNFSGSEKKQFSKILRKYTHSNIGLFVYSIRYPLEYKLRKFKSRIFN